MEVLLGEDASKAESAATTLKESNTENCLTDDGPMAAANVPASSHRYRQQHKKKPQQARQCATWRTWSTGQRQRDHPLST